MHVGAAVLGACDQLIGDDDIVGKTSMSQNIPEGSFVVGIEINHGSAIGSRYLFPTRQPFELDTGKLPSNLGMTFPGEMTESCAGKVDEVPRRIIVFSQHFTESLRQAFGVTSAAFEVVDVVLSDPPQLCRNRIKELVGTDFADDGEVHRHCKVFPHGAGRFEEQSLELRAAEPGEARIDCMDYA